MRTDFRRRWVQFWDAIAECARADTEWVNTVIPRYVEPNQRWSDHAANLRRVEDDVIADEGSREQSSQRRESRWW